MHSKQLTEPAYDWMIFHDEHTGTTYCWNGTYPIRVSPGGDIWHIAGELTTLEGETLRNTLNSRRRTFTIKNRPKFHVQQRGRFIKP